MSALVFNVFIKVKLSMYTPDANFKRLMFAAPFLAAPSHSFYQIFCLDLFFIKISWVSSYQIVRL